MKDAIKSLSIEDAKKILSEMEYALVYEMSNMYFDRIEHIAAINWEEMIEAYFFDEKREIHIFLSEEGLKAVLFSEPEGCEYLDRNYEIANKYKAIGETVVKREYFEYDDEGQLVVVYTKLVGVSKE